MDRPAGRIDDVMPLLRVLAVFQGGFTADAVQAVGGPELAEDIPAVLEQLVTRGLVTPLETTDGSRRYALAESAAGLAAGLLSTSEAEGSLRERHADYFLAQAGPEVLELEGDARRAAFERLVQEYENVTTALLWVLEAAADEPDEAKAEALRERAGAVFTLSAACQELERWTELQNLTPLIMGLAVGSVDDSPGTPLYWFGIGGEREEAQDWDGALEAYREALAAAGDEPIQQVRPYEKMARVFFLQGRYQEALEMQRRSTHAARHSDTDILVTMSLAHEARFLIRLGDFEAALEAISEALDLNPPQNAVSTVELLASRAQCRLRMGDPGAAEADLADAWRILEPMGDMPTAGGVQARLYQYWSVTAELHSMLGDLAGAAQAWKEAVYAARMVEANPMVSGRRAREVLAEALNQLSHTLLSLGREEEAQAALDEVQSIWRDLDMLSEDQDG